MAAGLRVYSPSGDVWLDTDSITCRVMGILSTTGYFVGEGYPTDPDTGGFYIDFLAPVGTTPWAFAYGSNGRPVICYVSRSGTDLGRIVFATGDPGGYPVNFFYGYC